MDSLAITDHGALYGVIDFYRSAIEEGVRPIIGCEVYVAPRSHRDRTPADRTPYHLTLLAKDNTGYKNLLKLVTRAHLDGFYYRPRVDRDLLQEHRQGLVALSGCLASELSHLVLEDRQEEARSWARWAKEVFGGDLYLELQRHPGLDQLDTLNAGLFQLHRELGLPLAATNDFHYVSPEDAPLQDILICIHTNTTINDDKRLKMEGDSYYLKSPAEMAELFPDFPEALANTQRIAEECSVSLSFDQTHLPDYQPPDGQTPDEYLARLCREGLERRRSGAPKRYEKRLAYELEVISQTRFANYFLVVWDITAFARDRGILYGVRGSAAASLVLYCLGVTDVDPLEYNLVFERFLNVERKEMPDIDMDFQDDRRDEVIRHVVRTYGSDRVAQIITYGTMGPRAAIRDVGRAMAMPYPDVDRVARLVPFRARTMEEAIAGEPELQQLRTDNALRRLMDTAQKVEGMVRHVSTHAAGVVISGEPLTEYVPLQRPVRGSGGEDEISMTQFSMEPIAQLGLLKMDFLGLANLTILKRAIDRIAETRGIHLDLQTVPLDDAKTFEALSSGETADVFQLEGSGMRRHIKELKPASLAEVSAMIALYRPGPMEHIETYIRAKHGEQARYPHESLREVLEETYGVIVYQDQVLRIVQIVAGYSLGEADIVRKAMGKKIPAIMQQERARFIQGALAQGYAEGEAEAIFHLIEPFAGYAFNKAHAVSYALIAYWTAYFKANYPVEYMAAVLDIRMENQDKVAGSVAECQRLKILVHPPDVNHSDVMFAIERDAEGKAGIRFGLAAVKNVGVGAVEPLVQARREGGPFQSVEDLCRRVELKGLNRRILESLIKAGALDSLGEHRGALLAGLDRILSLAQREAKLRQTGQTTMFDLFGETVDAPLPALELPYAEPVSPREKLTWERELMGVAFSDNPMSALVASVDPSVATISVQDLDPEQAGRRVVVVGQVESANQRWTREGKPFVSAMLALLGGALEVVAWPDVYEQSRDLWEEGNLLQIVGQIRVREDRMSLVCKEAATYHVPSPDAPSTNGAAAREESGAPAATNGAPRAANGAPRATNGAPPPPTPSPSRVVAPPKKIRLVLRETADPLADEGRLREALQTLLEYPGSDRVLLELHGGNPGVRTLEAPMTASAGPEMQQALTQLLGPESVHVAG